MATEVVEDDEAYREGTQSLDVPSEASILGRGAGIVAGERETALGGLLHRSHLGVVVRSPGCPLSEVMLEGGSGAWRVELVSRRCISWTTTRSRLGAR